MSVKICDAIKRGVSVLRERDSAHLLCEVLLSYVLRCSREYVFTYSDLELSATAVGAFLNLVKKCATGYPLAYLIKNKEFYGLDFYVDERVLIPRPETELTVTVALSFLSPKSTFLDIGTGSSAISVSLLKNIPGLCGTASDISADALHVARINAEKHSVSDRLMFIESDLLSNISGKYDVICANLPYVGTKINDFVDKNVEKFEPHTALFGGADGLSLYKKLFQQLVCGKVEFRYLIGEFGFGQVDDLQKLLNKYFDQRWEVKTDLQSIPRVFIVYNNI